MNYSQMGSFPLWSLREGVRHAHFRLMSDVDAGIGDIGCGEAKVMATKQKAYLAITKKELAYLLSRLALLTQLPCKFAA